MKSLLISTCVLFLSIQLIVGWVGLIFQQFGEEYEYHHWMLIMLLVGCVFLVISIKYLFKWLNGSNENLKELKKSDKNGQGWFDSYQDVDAFLFDELEKRGKEFPISDNNKPEINTIKAIQLLINNDKSSKK